MTKDTKALGNDLTDLAEDARTLVAATADVAAAKVVEARHRVSAALERGKEICGNARERAIEQVHAADAVVHNHPYQAIAISAVAGMMFGFLLAVRCNSKTS